MLISFIIPVYNTQIDKLTRCVNSIISIQNNLFDKEIILVDDGSDEETANHCDKICDIYNDIRCIHKINGGVSSARNVGINEAKGDYLFFVDSDDSLISESLNNLEINDEDIIYTDFVIAGRDNKNVRYLKLFKTGGGKSAGGVIAKMSVNGDLNSSCGKIIRTSFIREKGISFNESIITAEDAKFMLGLLKNNPKISYLPVTTYKYDYDINTNDKRLVNSTEQFLDNELAFLSELKDTAGLLVKDENIRHRIHLNCDERSVKVLFNSTTTLLKEHVFDGQRKAVILELLNSIETAHKNQWKSKYRLEYELLAAKRWSVIRAIGSLRYAYLRIKDKPIRIRNRRV